MSSMTEWFGMFNQVIAAIAASGSSSQSRSLEAVEIVEKARRLGAQEFQGTTDPIQAESWIQRIERVMEVMQCSEEQKVSMATFLLEGRALH